MIEFTEEQIENFTSYLGEGIHTAFRKAADSQESHEIWLAIRDLDGDEWMGILRFAAEPLLEYAAELTLEQQKESTR